LIKLSKAASSFGVYSGRTYVALFLI